MIDILMATYNGEKYLDLQLFSLVNQTYKDWSLYIHDDGSTDNTLKIIREWLVKDNRIHLIEDEKICQGAGNNFFHLLPFSTEAFICFCDQDDFWFENKLFEYVSFMEKLDNSKPQCLFASAYIWNKDTITPFMHERSDSLTSILFTGGTQGCSIVFNKRLICKALKLINKNIFLHDYIIVLIAMLFGEMHYSNHKLMLYRQHSQNVTEHMPTNIFEKIKRVVYTNRKKSFLYPHLYDDVKTIYETFKSEFSKTQKKIFVDYLSLPSLSWGKRFIRIIFSSYKTGQHNHLMFVLKFLLRKKYC